MSFNPDVDANKRRTQFPAASTFASSDQTSPSVPSLPASNTSPLVPSSTIYKLLLFTLAMFTLPLLSYFASVNTIFSGNSSYAGALAALVANVVLGAYIVAAVREDVGEPVTEKTAEKRE